MRLGYMPDTHADDYDAPHPGRDEVAEFVDHLLETSKLAEDVGFDGLWVPDRHMRAETYVPDQMGLLASLATITDDIKLGTWANVLSLYNPMRIAEQVAYIDQLSKGRFVYVPSMGYHPGYPQYFGHDPDGKFGRFIDAMEIIKKAWDSSKEEPFTHDGKYHQFEEVYQSPDPYQEPRPPIWPGGQAEPAIERAGKLGECWALDPFPLEENTFEEQIELYEEAAAENGNDARIGLMRDAYVAPTQEEAEDVFGPIFKEELLFYYRQGILTHHPDFQSEDDFTLENLRDHMVIGSPEDCIEQMAEYEEKYDIDYCVMRFRLPKGPSLEEERDAVELFGEEVVPYFHEEDDGEWILNDEDTETHLLAGY